MNIFSRCKLKESDVILTKWFFATSILVTASLAHIYAAPFLTYEPEMIAQQCNLTSLNESNQFQGISPLQVTLYHTFDPKSQEKPVHNEAQDRDKRHIHPEEHVHKEESIHQNDHGHEEECIDPNHGTQHQHHNVEPFCCMLWLKMVFMAGFALSQFSCGVISATFSLGSILRSFSQSLIVCGLLASLSSE